MKNIAVMTIKNHPSLFKKWLGFFIILFVFILPSLVRADITTGLVGEWTMDSADINWSTNTVIDRSGNGNAGTLVGMTSAANAASGVAGTIGLAGQALQFTGPSTYININGSQALNASLTNAFTYSAWVYMSGVPTSASPIIYKNDGENFMLADGGNNGLIGLQPGGTTVGHNFPTSLNVPGQWYHLVSTFDGSSEAIYVNGVSQCYLSCPQTTGIAGITSVIHIGGPTSGGGGFNGLMQDVRIYDRALSPSDVLELYQTTSVSTTALPVPAVPQGFASPANTATTVSLSWNLNAGSDNVVNYKLYEEVNISEKTFENAFPVPSNGSSMEPAYGDAIYSWLLSNGYLNSSGQVNANLTSQAVLNALSSAFTDTAELLGESSEYQVILGILQNPPQYSLIAVISNNTTSYQVTNLIPGASYSFTLSAINNVSMEGAQTSAVTVSTQSVASSTVTPDQYLAGLQHPVFNPGNTLPILTRWGWAFSVPMNQEMANWDYALDFGAPSSYTAGDLQIPSSRESQLVALAQSNPTKYKMSVLIPGLSGSQIPSDALTPNDTNGNNSFSPEASDSDLSNMDGTINGLLQPILNAGVTISITLNGGERYMGPSGQDGAWWWLDPRVNAGITEFVNVSDYQSERKAHQETYFNTHTHALVGSTSPYIWYYAGGDQFRADSCSDWNQWDWDYQWMYTASDYPNTSIYYQGSNSGWTGHLAMNGDCIGNSNSDMLSQALNAYGYAATVGKTLSYNWVNGGSGMYGFGDPVRFYGFLKSYYTSGMIGGIATLFDYPVVGFDASFASTSPPPEFVDVATLGQVHAEFSYLEDILRNGTLLPGEDINIKNPNQPAYEFRTGFADTRVLVRKMNGQKRWLISAWAADNVTRAVIVAIPVYGAVSVQATPAGSIYDARVVSGNPSLTLLDNGSEVPAPLVLPSSTPDADAVSGSISAPVVSLATDHSSYSIPATVNLTATATTGSGATITSVAFYNGPTLISLQTVPSSTNTYVFTWSSVPVGNYSSLTAIAYDSNGNSTTSAPVSMAVTGYALTMSVAGSGAGGISVASTNINNCSNTCTAYFNVGTSLSLTVTASSGSTFTGWSGGGCSGTGACVVTMNASQTVTATFNTSTGNVLYGDVNGDGNVTIYDAELTAQYAVGLPVSNFNTTAAEVDGNSTVDIYDAYLIAKYAVGLISKFPVQ